MCVCATVRVCVCVCVCVCARARACVRVCDTVLIAMFGTLISCFNYMTL